MNLQKTSRISQFDNTKLCLLYLFSFLFVGFGHAQQLQSISKELVSSKETLTNNQSTNVLDALDPNSKVVIYPTIILFLSNGGPPISTTLKYHSIGTLGLDPGYDAGAFQDGTPSFALNTRLVTGDQGIDFTLQCLPNSNYSSYAIQVSVYASAGSNLTFSSSFSGDLPDDLHFYLEDLVTNQITDLKVEDYELNNQTALNGIGRFYLHTTNDISTIGDSLDSEPCQVITLPDGWSYYSSYIAKENTDVALIFEPITDDIVIVKDFDGEVYFPEWDFNGIGEVSVDQAYMVKVHQETTFETCGTQISPELMSIDLEAGWNFIPYLRVESAPVSSVLADLNANNNLVMVKDYLGNAYYPSESFDGLGDMQAGQGYLLNVISPAVLHFLSNDQSY